MCETRLRFNKEESHFDNIETHITNIGAKMTNLKIQISQLATSLNFQPKGKFPSDTDINPKEHCKAITLRNDKKIGESIPTKAWINTCSGRKVDKCRTRDSS